MIIAVDFDGTLCENKYPQIGEPNELLIALILNRQKNGDKFILWTCRQGRYLSEAVRWCEERHLYFDAINKNLSERISSFGSDSRKVSADEYWDDKAYNIIFLKEGCFNENKVQSSYLYR